MDLQRRLFQHKPNIGTCLHNLYRIFFEIYKNEERLCIYTLNFYFRYYCKMTVLGRQSIVLMICRAGRDHGRALHISAVRRGPDLGKPDPK